MAATSARAQLQVNADFFRDVDDTEPEDLKNLAASNEEVVELLLKAIAPFKRPGKKP